MSINRRNTRRTDRFLRKGMSLANSFEIGWQDTGHGEVGLRPVTHGTNRVMDRSGDYLHRTLNNAS